MPLLLGGGQLEEGVQGAEGERREHADHTKPRVCYHMIWLIIIYLMYQLRLINELYLRFIM